MQTDITFHCDIDYNFRSPEEQVRAFPYHDYAICLHTHSFYEINIVLSGRGVHQIMGTSLPVKAGAVFIIPPMVPHAYYDTENMDVFHILVRPEVIQKELKDACCVEDFCCSRKLSRICAQPLTHPLFCSCSKRI
ncbi:MAG: AraC family ligand binding domain-containing protein [Oscillospiraceae bacterium]|nr:AraC family ligand binding domain-containing protein [Oscillospiraceae bacterium]